MRLQQEHIWKILFGTLNESMVILYYPG